MNTLENFRHLFAYNEWANRRIFDAIKARPLSETEKVIRALAHILIAEKMWLVRLQTNADTTRFDFWPELSLDECGTLFEENRESYASFFDRSTDASLDRVATYKNSRGVEYQTSYRDILTHVLLHASYHRGQAAQAARAAGLAPAYTDYIAFVRERDAAKE